MTPPSFLSSPSIHACHSAPVDYRYWGSSVDSQKEEKNHFCREWYLGQLYTKTQTLPFLENRNIITDTVACATFKKQTLKGRIFHKRILEGNHRGLEITTTR